jgi:alkylated DNA repair dioxygenase AlkB
MALVLRIPVKQTYTLTFGERAENHVGMEQIGTQNLADGFSIADLISIMVTFQSRGCVCELVKLSDCMAGVPVQEAAVLVIRNAIHPFDASVTSTALLSEQKQLPYDSQAWMHGRVVNKHARHNICFDTVGHEPDYPNKKGRVVAYRDVPVLAKLREQMPEFFGPKSAGLAVEGNYYYDVSKCGIGFHGDAERRRVIGLRLGASMNLHYQWYHQSQPVGPRTVLELHHGDMYVMSEKASGWDWRRPSQYTLRHAAGCAKFTE